MSERYETTKEHAFRMGVDESTVRRWCETGKMPGAYRVGSRWRIKPDRANRASEAGAVDVAAANV